MSHVRTTKKSSPRRGTAEYASRKFLGRPQGQIAPGGRPISVTPNRQQALTRAALPHYWHPNRPGVEHPPPSIATNLAKIHADLRLTRPPLRAPVPVRSWLLWYRKPSITHAICPGWHLLMAWELNGHPLPLEESLLFAAIYHFDARHCGSAVQYFDRIIAERDRSRAVEKARYRSTLMDEAKEFRESLKIKNIGVGSKFALHHDGTLLPSRGEVNWSLERLRHTLPRRVRDDQERQRDESAS